MQPDKNFFSRASFYGTVLYAADNLIAYFLNGKTALFFYSNENCNIVLHINIKLYWASKYKYLDES
jgi:hypothetical protein